LILFLVGVRDKASRSGTELDFESEKGCDFIPLTADDEKFMGENNIF
jgi:hypothetical protein